MSCKEFRLSQNAVEGIYDTSMFVFGCLRSAAMTAKKKQFTFRKKLGAWTATRSSLVYVPDQVLRRPKAFMGRVFPVIRKDGSRGRAVLRIEQSGDDRRAGGGPVVAMI